MSLRDDFLEPNIITDRFRIRRIREEDVTVTYLDWLQDRESNPYIQSVGQVNGLEELTDYVKDKNSKDDVLFLVIFDKFRGDHIGNIKFEPIVIETGSATMGILIGDSRWRGKGAAFEVIQYCADWLKSNMGVHTLNLGVDKRNRSAYKAYLGCGFRVVTDDGSVLRMERIERPSLRLALGTAQFGLDYGVSNKRGRVSSLEAGRIIKQAWREGFGILDTAMLYGDSETVLGQIGVTDWKIVTKLPSVDLDSDNVLETVESSVRQSIQRMGVEQIYGLLLHRPSQLLENNGWRLKEALCHCREIGLIKKVGVSIYNPSELDKIWPAFIPDLVQTPINILDRRISRTGWLKRLNDNGVEVHARSAFLQGLLLMPPSERPARFSRWEMHLREWDRWIEETSLSRVHACLGFVLSQRDISTLVVGVEDCLQLDDIIRQANAEPVYVPDFLACDDEDLIDPSKW